MRFILLKDVAEYKDTISEVIMSLVGANIKIETKNKHLVIYHRYENLDEIEELLLALEAGLMFSVHAYNSYDREELKLKKELNIALKLIDSIPNGVFDLKSALLANNKINNPNEVLEFILDRSDINQDFIKDFVECDLNVSKASKVMLIHRNTMNYKLDKLKEVSDFDLRKFKDAYILYSLINDK